VLAPLVAAIQAKAPDPATLAQAQAAVDELKAELAKGKGAEDQRVATILDKLAEMVPGAIGAVVAAFGTPLLGGIVGPVTAYVLKRLTGG